MKHKKDITAAIEHLYRASSHGHEAGVSVCGEAEEGWEGRYHYRRRVASTYIAAACLAALLVPVTVALMPPPVHARCHLMEAHEAQKSVQQMIENIA